MLLVNSVDDSCFFVLIIGFVVCSCLTVFVVSLLVAVLRVLLVFCDLVRGVDVGFVDSGGVFAWCVGLVFVWICLCYGLIILSWG